MGGKTNATVSLSPCNVAMVLTSEEKHKFTMYVRCFKVRDVKQILALLTVKSHSYRNRVALVCNQRFPNMLLLIQMVKDHAMQSAFLGPSGPYSKYPRGRREAAGVK